MRDRDMFGTRISAQEAQETQGEELDASSEPFRSVYLASPLRAPPYQN